MTSKGRRKELRHLPSRQVTQKTIINRSTCLHKETICYTTSTMPLIPLHEISFDTMRSTGSGGQSVNTTDSAVRGTWNLSKHFIGTAEERIRIIAFLEAQYPKHIKHNILGQTLLVAKSQTEKSQLQNKQHVLQKLNELLKKAKVIPKKRVNVIPKKTKNRMDRERMKNKVIAGRKKKLRKGSDALE